MKKRYILLTFLLISFVILTILVITNNTIKFDDTIYNMIFRFRCQFLDIYFKSITKLANTITIISIVIILILTLKKEDGIILGISTISSVVTNTMIKYLIRRPRPSHLRLISQGGYSFPSGHSMISICVYGMLIYLILKNVENKKVKVLATITLILLITSIGLSRIYVGVHYPSDVLAGYLLASSLLIIIISVYNKSMGEYK